MAASSGSRLFGILILGYPIPTVLILVNALALINAPCPLFSENTVDSRYLEIGGTLKNTSRYPYFDISDL